MSVKLSIRHMAVSHVIKTMVRELCNEVKNKYDGIQIIDVMIDNINGPHKYGIDKRCHIKVRGKEHLAIDIDEIDEDLDCSIDNAFHRLKCMLRSRYTHHRHLAFPNMSKSDSIKARGA